MANPIRQVSDIITSIAGQLTGVDMSDATNLFGAIERAARVMFQKAKMPEAVSSLYFNLFSGVYDYPADTRIFGTSIIDLRPQGISRNAFDYVYKDNISDFDRRKKLARSGYKATFEYVNGQPIIRVATPRVTEAVPIDPMNQIGNWKVSGTATNLAVDSTVFYDQPAALSITLPAGGASSGGIQQTLANKLNLTGYLTAGTIFAAVQQPTAGNITAITVVLTDATGITATLTATAAFLGPFIAGVYQLVPFPMANAVLSNAAFNVATISKASIAFSYDGTLLNNVRIGAFFAALPSPVELIYSTAAIFLGFASGLLQQKILSTQDYIVLSDAAWSIFELEATVQLANQFGGSLASGIVAGINAQLNGARARNGQIIELGLYDLYRADNPTQELHSTGNYRDDMD